MGCFSLLTKFEIAKGEAFENPDQVVVSEAFDYLIRLCGRHQLAAKAACPFYR